jgi:diketogulonate reductase-like aldo/keto reductase
VYPLLHAQVEGCGNSVDPRSPILAGACREGTLAAFNQNLEELDVARVDLTLLHSPPCVPGASWVENCMGNPAADLIYPHRCNCSAPEPCAMMQQQWLALEEMYAANKTGAIGVSNFCSQCLECVGRVATVTPHVNQFQYHAGMPGADPGGLVSFSEAFGTRVQAYRPLAHGEGSLLADPTVKAIGRAHGKSSAQVALRWVVQLGQPLVTSTENPSHMVGDLDIFDWALTDEEMGMLSGLDTHPDDPVSTMCVL